MSRKAKIWQERWQEGDRVGSGGQGAAIHVTSTTDSAKQGVLKTLHNNQSIQARGRMYREVVALATLAQAGLKVPNVIDHNTDQYEDLAVPLYFVMDMIHGKNLKDEIAKRGPQPLDQAMSLCMDVGKTVLLAHKNGVLHRDLKPDNVVARDFDSADLVIVDYGLSFNHADDEETITQTDDQLRNRFLALPETNTPGGNRRDPRSDVTAVSGILYFCLTGHVPGHLTDSSNRPPHRRDGISVRQHIGTDPRCESIDVLLDRAFSVDINHRFQSCEELIGRLQTLRYPVDPADEDPIQLASMLKDELLRRDQITQLADLRTETKAVLETMMQYIKTLRNNLGAFNISKAGGFPVSTPALPEGVIRIENELVIVVQLQNHPHTHHSLITLGMRGNECVILRTTMVTQVRSPKVVPKGAPPWEELGCFNPKIHPSANVLMGYIKQTVNKAMREMMTYI